MVHIRRVDIRWDSLLRCSWSSISLMSHLLTNNSSGRYLTIVLFFFMSVSSFGTYVSSIQERLHVLDKHVRQIIAIFSKSSCKMEIELTFPPFNNNAECIKSAYIIFVGVVVLFVAQEGLTKDVLDAGYIYIIVFSRTKTCFVSYGLYGPIWIPILWLPATRHLW